MANNATDSRTHKRARDTIKAQIDQHIADAHPERLAPPPDDRIYLPVTHHHQHDRCYEQQRHKWPACRA